MGKIYYDTSRPAAIERRGEPLAPIYNSDGTSGLDPTEGKTLIPLPQQCGSKQKLKRQVGGASRGLDPQPDESLIPFADMRMRVNRNAKIPPTSTKRQYGGKSSLSTEICSCCSGLDTVDKEEPMEVDNCSTDSDDTMQTSDEEGNQHFIARKDVYRDAEQAYTTNAGCS